MLLTTAVNKFVIEEVATNKRAPALLTMSWRAMERHAKVRDSF